MQAECNFLHSGIVFEEFTSGDPHKIRCYGRLTRLSIWIWEVSIWLSERCNHRKSGDHRLNRCLYMCGVWAFMAVDVMAD